MEATDSAANPYVLRTRQIALVCAIVAAGLGGLALAQWLLDGLSATAVSRNGAAVVAARALCLALLGLAAAARNLGQTRPILRQVGTGAAATAGLIAVAALTQYPVGIDLGGGPALSTGCLVALAAATMLTDIDTRGHHRPTEFLCFAVLAAMLAVFFDHLLNASVVIGLLGELTGVSLGAMLAMSLVCVSLLGLHPDRGAMAPIVARSVAGEEARLGLLVVGPIAVIVLSIVARGRDAGWFGTTQSQALAFAAAVVMGVIAAWRSFSHLVAAERIAQGAVIASRQSEGRFRTLFEAAPSGMILVDAAGRIVMANGRGEAMLGFGPGGLAGQPVDSLLPERCRAAHTGDRMRSLAASIARPMGEGGRLPAQRRDGTEFPAEIALSPVQTGEGKMVIVSLVDVSHRVEADHAIELLNGELSKNAIELRANVAALRENQHRLQLALDTHRVGFWDWNLETQTLSWDDNWRLVHGRPNGTPNRGDWLEIVHQDDRPAIAAAFERQSGGLDEVFQVEYRAINGSGQLIWVCCRGRMADRPSGGRPGRMSGTVEEITEWKAVEELVERRNRELQTLLHVTSHDLREPLRAISGFSKLLGDRHQARLDDTGRDYLGRVIRAAARLDGLIDDIWTLAKARRIERPTDPVSVDELVQEAVNRLDERIRETKATVRVTPGFGVGPVNRTWVTQAAYNLVLNALKFAKPGEPPEVDITPYPDANRPAGLVVRDRGIGVAPEHAERIFRLFQRAVGHEVEGTGAGLAIVREVAERHGGRAWVQNRAGGGSEFIMTFRELGISA